MVVRIVIAGQSQCDMFAEVCLIADHINQNLPNFCYERIQKSVSEWEKWLCKINQANKWHHMGSPLIWKELLMKGSKPYYIGGGPEFLEYLHSYYQFDSFILPQRFQSLVTNFSQYQTKLKHDNKIISQRKVEVSFAQPTSLKTDIIICISGAGHPLAMYLLSELFDMSLGDKTISQVYIYDKKCPLAYLTFIEHECKYIGTAHSGKVVKVVEKLGMALIHTDLLIIFDHVPFDPNMPLGDWLHANSELMEEMSFIIKASASSKINILFPNLGPACYNATILMNLVSSTNKNKIVVATSDLGLGISATAAEIAEVPSRNMFCPPVWGFVGINQLIDIRTTIHKYNTFEPYTRYAKIKNSSLIIGTLTPEMRTMEYLMYFDEKLWLEIAKKKCTLLEQQSYLNKATAVLNVIKLWIFDTNPSNIISLGIKCDGSFGLNFNGAFSQPAKLVNGEWKPASDFLLPKDPQMKLPYLEQMATFAMELKRGDLPEIPIHI